MNVNKKALFSEKVSAGKRTYFFDVKETSQNSKYIVISESRPSKTDGEFEHDRIMLFEDNIPEFLEGFKKALKFVKTGQ